MRKMPYFMKSVLVVLFSTFLIGCQTNNESASSPESGNSSESSSSKISFSNDVCEKSKKSWDYNTAGGRAMANITCSGKTYPDYKSYSQAAWREHTRQRQCKLETGKFCED